MWRGERLEQRLESKQHLAKSLSFHLIASGATAGCCEGEGSRICKTEKSWSGLCWVDAETHEEVKVDGGLQGQRGWCQLDQPNETQGGGD